MSKAQNAPQTPRFPTNPFPAPIPGKELPPARPTTKDAGSLKPGFKGVRGAAIAPDAARQIIESRKIPGKTKTKAKKASKAKKSVMGGSAVNTVQGPASIVELARALKNDPQLIYEFVANNIEFLPTYGLQKGGLGALIDGCGNAFDQADLMVQLLTEAGFTARYVSGEIRLWEADWNAWLNTDANAWAVWSAVNLLAAGGIPVTPTWDTVNFVWYIDVSHVWVKVTIGGTDYYFDPARKTYTNTTGVNLATATGYNQTTFLSDAASGATITSDYAEDWNIANINDNLEDYAMNLVSWIRTNMPGAKLEDIVGGRSINKVSIPLLQTSISYVTPGSTPTVWTTVPDAYKTTLQVQYYDINTSGFSIDETFFSCDIHNKRLTMWFNGSDEVELILDGSVVGTSTAQAPFSWSSVLMSVVHPYPTTFADTAAWHQINYGQRTAIAHAWGNCGREPTNIHQQALAQNMFNGGGSGDENILGQSLTTIWQNLNGQTCQAADILGRLTNSVNVYHHQVGIAYHDGGPGIDMGQVVSGVSALDSDADKLNTLNTAVCMHGVAMEEGVVAQVTGNPSANATRLICEAIAQGQKIYIADTTNWSTNVRPNLVNYTTGDLDAIENWYVNAGWRVFVPEDGATAFDSFTGFGYMAVPLAPYSGTVGIIAGALKGEKPADNQSDSDTNNNTDENKNQNETDKNKKKDPVGTQTGNYVYEAKDLTLGSGPAPFELSFGRHYDSTKTLVSGPLGLGWRHSFEVSVTENADGFRGLGVESPVEAAAAIAEMFVSVQILSDQTRPLNKYLSLVVANQWLMDQNKSNTVQLTLPDTVETFVKLPDGSYVAPRNKANELVLGGGLYTMKTPQGVEYSFDSSGNIDTIDFPYGVTMTFGYTTGKLTSVSNGLGRTLTLNYTGDLLTSVSDGTGRSVSYSVDGSNMLTAFTDANGEDTTYSYSSEGWLEETFYPEHPSTAFVTNIYDSRGRVKEQTLAEGGTTQMFFAGSRTEFIDPEGNSEILYFDKFGNTLVSIDQLGNSTSREFDGRQRLVKEIKPEGNYSEFTYDGMNNLLSVNRVAKPGSGLPDISVSYTYDPLWNKVATYTDGNGNVTTNTYDPSTGQLTNVEFPMVNLVNPEISMTYTVRGQVEDVTDQEGMVTHHEYNATTEVLETATRDYGMGKLNLATIFDYDAVGNCTSVTDARGNETTFTFDDLRQTLTSTAPTPFSFQSEMEYDKNGNSKLVKKSTGDIGTPWQIYQLGFNAVNRLTDLTDPLSCVTVYSYDSMNRLTTIQDAESRTVTREYDELSRIHKLIDAATVDATTNGYTDNGQQDSQEDGRTKVTGKTFDGHDRLETVTYADATTEEFTYDDNGNVLTFQNRKGDIIAFDYDALNRLIEKAPDSQPTVTLEYDLVGRLKKSSTTPVMGNPASGDFDYSYDAVGRLEVEESPDGKQVQYEYDENGNVTKVTWPDSYYVVREYDELNRLTAVKLNGSGSAALAFAYDDLSRRTSITCGNGVVTNYTYNWDDTVESIEHVFSGSSVQFDYGYNNVKEVTSQDVDDSAFMWHPASGGTVTYATADDVNAYPTVGGVTQTVDDNGCLTGDGTWTFTYDTEQHIVSATDGVTTVSFVHDGQHRQIQKTVGAAKTRFIYSGWQRIADYDGAMDTLQNRFVYGVGLDEPLIIVSSGGTLTYLHHDKMGSIVATSNSSGVNTNKNKFGPFGETASLSGTSSFGYTGQRFDSELGLHYYKRRYYSPKTGRFLQPDPAGYLDPSLNRYTYVLNSPLKYIDPMGLENYTAGPQPVGSSPGTSVNGSGGSPSSAGTPSNGQTSNPSLGASDLNGMGVQTSTSDGSGKVQTYNWGKAPPPPPPPPRPVPPPHVPSNTTVEPAEFDPMHVKIVDPRTGEWVDDDGGLVLDPEVHSRRVEVCP